MIRKYRAGDALLVLPQEKQKLEARYCANEFERLIAFSLVDDDTDTVLAVFGFEVFDEDDDPSYPLKTAQCYALIGKDCGRKLYQFIRFLKVHIPLQAQIYHVGRVLMTVRSDFPQAIRLAHLLGFSFAENLKDFFAHFDYQLFERIFYYGRSSALN